jgi:hypothetical protein
MAKTVSDMDQGGEHQRTIDEVSKYQRWRQTGVLGDLQDKLREYLLTVWAASGIEMA